MKHIELSDSFVLGNFPASKHISVFCSTFPDISWRPSLFAQGHVARHGADESTAKWANGTTSRDCKDAGRSRIASTVPTQLGLTLGWDWHPTCCCCCCWGCWCCCWCWCWCSRLCLFWMNWFITPCLLSPSLWWLPSICKFSWCEGGQSHVCIHLCQIPKQTSQWQIPETDDACFENQF